LASGCHSRKLIVADAVARPWQSVVDTQVRRAAELSGDHGVFRQRLLWLHGADDAYTPIIGWRHYGDHRLAPLRRSCAGAYAPIINWLLYGDP
jgi:hypothetical protein